MALTITETGFDMGLGEHRSWHLDEHVHVAFGTLAKLREEVMEYQEACRQQLPMAALFEFSDIIGAIYSVHAPLPRAVATMVCSPHVGEGKPLPVELVGVSCYRETWK